MAVGLLDGGGGVIGVHFFHDSRRHKQLKTKCKWCYTPCRSVGMMFIFLSEAVEPVGGYTTESVSLK